MAPKVLVVLTSQSKMNNGHPTGCPSSLTHTMTSSTRASRSLSPLPPAAKPPLDQASVEMFKGDEESVKFLNEKKQIWEQTTPLKEFLGKASEFDAIFYPGGHGPMFDLVNDETSIKLIEEFYKAGKPVAAVCHGPIVFVNVKVDGKPLLEGREATGFSNSEEEAVKLTSAMPVLLEDEIKRVGGKYVKADDWAEKLAVDGQVITGQNPASAHAVGKAILKAIGA
ncbi:Class I glutamine amidotransferase-like [Fusarium oxysporum f. sp. vasinfectum]|nr:Class I glutamine amidotransferase-like [Fusarium oxysporum f. sp. vasinfectum]